MSELSDDASVNRFRRPGMLVVLVLLASIIALALAEIGIRIWAPHPAFQIDSRELYVRDPVTLFRLRANHEFGVTADGGQTTIRTNSQGLRYPVIPPRVPGRARIVLVGDSLLFGAEVRDSEVVSTQLENLLRATGRDVAVINAAHPSFDPRLEKALVKTLLDKLDPDTMILSLYIGNDFLEVNSPDEFRLAHVGIISRAAVAHGDRWYFPLSKRSHLFWRLLDAWQARAPVQISAPANPFFLHPHLVPTPAGVEEGWAACLDHITAIRDLVSSRNCSLVVIVIPSAIQVEAAVDLEYWPRHLDPASKTLDLDRPGPDLVARMAERNIAAIDLLPGLRAIRSRGNRLYYRVDTHMNAAGHAALAELIAAALVGAP